MLNKFVDKCFLKKEYLFYFEYYFKELFFIVKGCVRIYVIDFNGVEYNIFFLIENWWFGDL